MEYLYAGGAGAVIIGLLFAMLLRAERKGAAAAAEAKQEAEHAARVDAEKAVESARSSQVDVERQLQDRPASSRIAVDRLRKLKERQ